MIARELWGSAGGQPVDLFTLSNGSGMTVTVSSFGGVVQSIRVPSRDGDAVNVALGFASLDEYVANATGPSATYFGAVVGRYANRIAGPLFTLDGKRYELCGNDDSAGGVILHGGPRAFHAQVWRAESASGALRLSYVDPDGKNGFPGNLRTEVRYAVTRDNALRTEFRATTDAPTVVNLTNHTYFNLAGEGSGDVYGQLVALNGDRFLAVDEAGIPAGFAAVTATPFDFRVMKPIGQDLRAAREPGGEQLAMARGYDHTWVLAGSGYRLAAVACDPATGIALWVYTDQPGVQFYTANHLLGELVGTSARTYRQGDAFALETQHFPDTPHHIGEPGWPSVVLRPGEVLRTQTTYKFGVAGPELAGRIRL